MASNNSTSSNNEGRSCLDSAGGSSISNVPRGLLGKGGTPVAKSTRLPSVRAARDLTLGGAQRKTFKPNIPVRSKDKGPVGPIEDKLEVKEKKQKKDRDKTDGRGGRGRSGVGRGRDAPKTIQSQSIFQQGPTERTIKRESIYGGGSEYTKESTRATSTLRVKNVKPTKAETQELLDQLLRDDFIDDGEDNMMDITDQPVALPLLNPDKYEESLATELKSELKLELEVKTKASSIDPAYSSQVLDCDDDSLRLLLVQLPDCLPGLQSGDNSKSNVKTEPVSNPSKEQTASTADAVDEIANKMSNQFKLTDLNEGRVGKLQILKSGRTRLVLGDVIFDVNRGAPSGFLQELVCVDTDTEHGQISCLGPIKDKLVVVPNIDNLLLS